MLILLLVVIGAHWSIFVLSESQSELQRVISVLVLILHIPCRKCISTHASSMGKVKKLFMRNSIPLSISIARTAAMCKGLGKSGRKLLATDKRFHPINGVGIKRLKAGKSSALLNPNPWNSLIGVCLTVKCWF